jgi:hypothetical protein
VAQALEDLGYAYSKVDKPKKADAAFKQALAIREKQSKQDPAARAACVKRYAEFLRSTGRKDEATKLEGGNSAPAAAAKGAPVAPAAAKAPAAKPAPGKTASK